VGNITGPGITRDMATEKGDNDDTERVRGSSSLSGARVLFGGRQGGRKKKVRKNEKNKTGFKTGKDINFHGNQDPGPTGYSEVSFFFCEGGKKRKGMQTKGGRMVKSSKRRLKNSPKTENSHLYLPS